MRPGQVELGCDRMRRVHVLALLPNYLPNLTT
jgi:hypothetical protein